MQAGYCTEHSQMMAQILILVVLIVAGGHPIAAVAGLGRTDRRRKRREARITPDAGVVSGTAEVTGGGFFAAVF
jgi:hypothetical protein